MKKNLDMTEGKPISLLWAFTFPTLMGNLLNQVYSITDSIVVGRYLGQTALAAVGSTMPVILLLAALMIGINVGVGIIISRYFGQKNEELMRRAFVNSLYLGLFLSAGMMVMGLTFSGTILRWMGTPEGPLQEATAYLEISFITMICPLMYYLFSSAFRGLGDSQTALYCLIVSVLSNIGLDVLFVAVFRWGVAGSAWATALAQALSAVVAAVLLFRKYPMMRMRRQDLRRRLCEEQPCHLAAAEQQKRSQHGADHQRQLQGGPYPLPDALRFAGSVVLGGIDAEGGTDGLHRHQGQRSDAAGGSVGRHGGLAK